MAGLDPAIQVFEHRDGCKKDVGGPGRGGLAISQVGANLPDSIPPMTPFETIETDEMVAACAGGPGSGGGPLGHPKVYLNLAPSGRVECPYCSRLFVNRAIARAGGTKEGAAHG